MFAIAMAILIPSTADAYTSNGSDGQFQPMVSGVLDSTQSVFNFTNIVIPNGVTVSFGGIAAGQPIEILATGNIDIAGILDGGGNSLWIQTPEAIAFSGTLDGSNLTVDASSINISGTVASINAGTISINVGNGDDIGGGGTVTGSGATLCLSGSCQPPLNSGSVSIISPVGGGTINMCTTDCSLQIASVPEADSHYLMLCGLAVIGAIAHRKKLTNA